MKKNDLETTKEVLITDEKIMRNVAKICSRIDMLGESLEQQSKVAIR